jgi:hypothetical protein
MSSSGPTPVLRFQPELLMELPDPARHYLARSLTPGVQLATRVELVIEGESLRDGAFAPWIGRELIGWPRGFVFRADFVRPRVWLRRYLADQGEERSLVHWAWPAGSLLGADISRSLRHRLAAASLLLPDVLLPQQGTTWRRLDEHRAKAGLLIDDEPIDVIFSIGPDGKLFETETRCWSGQADHGRPGFGRWVIQVQAEGSFEGRSLPVGLHLGWRSPDGQLQVVERVTITQASFR